jgi:hypothetical protein
MQRIDRAIVGESARWGDNQREPSYTRADWLTYQNTLLSSYFPNRSNQVRNQFVANGWLVSLAAPLFSQFGGTISPGFQLTINKPAGLPAGAQILYTLDGSDPRDAATRLPGANATLYSGPVVLNAGAQVKARINFEANPGTGNDWSPLVDATFLLDSLFPVRITELHYNPATRSGVIDEQDMEFIEVTNTGSQTVSLDGVSITEFMSEPYTFGDGVSLAAGERMIVARSPAVAQSVYGAAVRIAAAGYGPGNLSNNGERVALLGPLGETIQDFVFDDTAPWPALADGEGRSLEIIDPLGDPSNPTNWRASSQVGGSPGAASGSLPGDYDGNSVVNEDDLGQWRASFGLTVPAGTGADGNGDGTIDAADYVVWRRAFASAASMASSARAAPEPSPESVVGSGSLSSAAIPVAPIEEHSRSRRAVRPLLRPRLIAAHMNDSELLAVGLNSQAVDAVFASATHKLRPITAVGDTDSIAWGDMTAELPDVAGKIWGDGPWLDRLGTALRQF